MIGHVLTDSIMNFDKCRLQCNPNSSNKMQTDLELDRNSKHVIINNAII